MRIRLDRFGRFLCGSALLVAAVVLASGWSVGEFFERHALRQQAAQTASFVNSEAHLHLSPDLFSAGPSPRTIEAFVRFMPEVSAARGSGDLPGIFRIKVYDRGARILWSNEVKLIGQMFPDNVNLRSALGGKAVTILEPPERSEHAFEHGHRWVAEAYMPISYPERGVVGVIETYRDATALKGEIARVRQLVWVITATGGVLLWGGLASLAWRTSVAERRATASLERAQADERFRLAVDAAPNAMVMVHSDGRIALVNGQVERLFGYTRDELLGRPVEMLVPERFRRDHEAQRAALVGNPAARPMGAGRDLYALRKDGTLVPVQVGLNPIVINGETLVLASIIDITEQKRIETERAQLLARSEHARVEAETANHAKDDFLAMLGHELRNPLGAIRTAMHILETVAADDPRAVQSRGVVVRQLKHLTQLVDDLLDLARLTSGKIALSYQPVNLAEIVRQTVDAVLSDRHGDRTVRVSLEDAWVEGDETRLYQIASNLVTNAVKYTPAGGTIAIDARTTDGAAVLTVSDTGVGIAASLLPHVFEPFRQGQRTLDRSQGGLGIGLTVVRKLAEAHAGTVSVTSDGPGRGSTFTVRLPARRVSESARTPARVPVAGMGPCRVLVVEDNPDAREMLKAMVELAGHMVQGAEDGLSALAVAESWKPEIVLVDIGLPGIDGYELARRLSAHAVRPRLVAITGYGQLEDRRRASEAGFDAHFVKPVDPDELLRVLAVTGSPP
jgi:PAS domain S-box-containing protein